MERKILRYILNICLLSSLLFSLSLPVQAQKKMRKGIKKVEKIEKKEKKDYPKYPLYNGIIVGVDVWNAMGKLLGDDYASTEIDIRVDLKNRFYPALEIGYGVSSTKSEIDINYKGRSPFFRVGMDYNALYKKKIKHKFLVGGRMAYAPLNYDIQAPALQDKIYGGELPSIDVVNQKGSMTWLEFCVGVHANLWKQMYMGWTIRWKFKMSASTSAFGDPWYVPGFGEYNDSSMGLSYTIGYKF